MLAAFNALIRPEHPVFIAYENHCKTNGRPYLCAASVCRFFVTMRTQALGEFGVDCRVWGDTAGTP